MKQIFILFLFKTSFLKVVTLRPKLNIRFCRLYLADGYSISFRLPGVPLLRRFTPGYSY